MRENEDILLLIQEIGKTKEILGKIDGFSVQLVNAPANSLDTKMWCIAYSEIFEKYYTALETLFLRISQFFENNLQKDKWHQDLLHKMTQEIPSIRKAVIDDETYRLLIEFMRFRHFRRYYLELEYDKDKIDFLLKKYNELKKMIFPQLDDYIHFLEELNV